MSTFLFWNWGLFSLGREGAFGVEKRESPMCLCVFCLYVIWSDKKKERKNGGMNPYITYPQNRRELILFIIDISINPIFFFFLFLRTQPN